MSESKETFTWRKVWRGGFAPLLSVEGLRALRRALQSDDARLIQGATSSPPPLMCVQDWPVDAVCGLGMCAVDEFGGFGTATVGEVEDFFARKCFEADQLLNEPAACRYFLNWFDDTPRDEMRRELLAEVELTLVGAEADTPAEVQVA